MQYLNIFIIYLALVSCRQEASKINSKANSTSAAVPVATIVPIDPSTAKLTSVSDPTLGNANQDSTLQVPTITLSGVGKPSSTVDYVMVARCNKTLKLTTVFGVDIDKVPQSDPMRLSQLEYVWINSIFGNKQECKLVGTKIAREQIQDLAAKSGNFYYVLNPCLNKVFLLLLCNLKKNFVKIKLQLLRQALTFLKV